MYEFMKIVNWFLCQISICVSGKMVSRVIIDKCIIFIYPQRILLINDLSECFVIFFVTIFKQFSHPKNIPFKIVHSNLCLFSFYSVMQLHHLIQTVAVGHAIKMSRNYAAFHVCVHSMIRRCVVDPIGHPRKMWDRGDARNAQQSKRIKNR